MLGWTTDADTATSGDDFTAVTAGTLTIAAGATTGTLTVSTEEDLLAEDDETFRVTITGTTLPSGVTLDTATATGTIEDDDTLAAAVTAGAPMVSEGSVASFEVALTGATSTADVVVMYTVTGTATSGTDYTAPSGSLTITAGATSTTFSIQTTSDRVLDPGETLIVTLTKASTAGTVTVDSTQATTTITDPGATVSVADVRATEGDDVEFAVRLSLAAGSDTVLGWTTAAVTATSGDDFTAVTAGALTIAAGDTTGTLTVSTEEDLLAEDDETFRVTITGTTLPSGVTLDTATATGTIEDDDTLAAAVTAGAPMVSEGSAASFEVALTGATSTADVVVMYTVTGTATSGTDYTAPSGSLTITAGATSTTFSIQTTSDRVLDPGETLIVTLDGASTAGTVTVDSTPATTTITDPGATVSVADVRATEGDDVEFTVRLSLAAGSDTVLGWTTVADTAASGDDFTAVTAGTLTIAAGATTGTLTVSTEEDLLAEDDETFRVTITGTTLPSGVTLDTATATGTIEDDDTLAAAVTAGAPMVSEGSVASFEVALTGATSTADVMVTYTVTGTATADTDYTAPSGSLTITAGESSGTITIRITSDSVLDRGETLIVTLTGASTAGTVTVDSTAATTTIVDSGTAMVSVADARAAEGDDVEFTVTLSGAAGSDTVLGWTTAADTATSGDDYTAVTAGTLTIAAGGTTGTLTVSTEEDLLAEDDETFRVTITGTTLPPGVSLDTAAATGTGTIEDDDTLTAEVTAGASTVPEGSAASFEVALTGATSTAAVVVTYTVTGTATPGTDYTAPSGSLTITAGASSTTLSIQTTSDSVLDRGETLIVTLTGARTAAGTAEYSPTVATTTITDSGTATVSVGAARATEGDDVEFTVELSMAAGIDTVLGWTTAAVTATSGDDYTAVTAGTLTISAGGTTGTLTVSTEEDLLAEDDETFTVTITGTTLPSGVSLDTATATGTIEDDDPIEASVAADAATATEGGSAEFTVTLTGATSTASVVVTYSVTGTATSGTDYTAPSGSLTLASGDSTGTISIPILGDDVLDPAETLTVTLNDATTTAGTVTVDATVATTMIVDSGAVTVSVAPASATEGEAVEFTVTLSGAVGSDVTFGWSTTDGTATTAGDDYTAVASGTVTVATGTTSATFAVTTSEDLLAEGTETFTVTLTAPGSGLPAGVSLGTATATGTIEDDDPIVASVAADAGNVAEGGSAVFTVTLSGATSTAAVVVSYTVGGTATAGTDYTAPGEPLELTLAAGAKTGTISIPTLTDSVLDSGETLIVTLTGASTAAGTAEYSRTAATTMIADSGTAMVSVADARATEGDDVEFTVRLSLAAGSDTVLGWTTAAVTATSGDDFTAVTSGTLTIAAGDTTGTLTVSTAGDLLAEADETFTVTITGTTLPSGVSLGTATATGTIEDDDPIVASVAADAATADEGGSAEFTVTLTGATSTASVVVTYSVTGTATSGTDYTAPATLMLTLAAGAKTGTISIPTVDDGVLDPGETLTVTLSSATTMAGTVTVDSTAVTTAIVDPGMVTVSVAAVAATVTEGTTAEFTVTLSGAVASDVALRWSIADGTAIAGEDYIAVSGGTVTLGAGTTSTTIEVAVTDDTLAESDETFTVILAAPGTGLPAGVSLGTATATATIEDDDPIKASVAGVETVVEGTAAEFTVTLTGATSTAPVVVSYTVGGTATSGTDYTAPATPATLTIAAGLKTGTISIPTVDDGVLDPGETLTVTLNDATTTTAGTVTVDATAATTTIADPGMVTVSVAAVAGTVAEGTVAQFTVTLSGAVGSDVALRWSTAGGTATAGEDYIAVSGGTVTLSAGTTRATIEVAVADDTLAESDETFTVILAAPGTGLPAGVSLGTTTATGTIEDNDPIKGTVAGAETVVEGTTAEFTVTLTNATSTAPVVVSYTVGGTATSGTDYTAPATPATLTIAAGVKTGTIPIPILDDGVLDPGETLTVTLRSATTMAGTVTVDSTAATTAIADPGMVTAIGGRRRRDRGRRHGGRVRRHPVRCGGERRGAPLEHRRRYRDCGRGLHRGVGRDRDPERGDDAGDHRGRGHRRHLGRVGRDLHGDPGRPGDRAAGRGEPRHDHCDRHHRGQRPDQGNRGGRRDRGRGHDGGVHRHPDERHQHRPGGGQLHGGRHGDLRHGLHRAGHPRHAGPRRGREDGDDLDPDPGRRGARPRRDADGDPAQRDDDGGDRHRGLHRRDDRDRGPRHGHGYRWRRSPRP